MWVKTLKIGGLIKKSKVYFNTSVVLAISILLIWYFLKDNYKISIEVLKSANVFWLFFAILFAVL